MSFIVLNESNKNVDKENIDKINQRFKKSY